MPNLLHGVVIFDFNLAKKITVYKLGLKGRLLAKEKYLKGPCLFDFNSATFWPFWHFLGPLGLFLGFGSGSKTFLDGAPT